MATTSPFDLLDMDEEQRLGEAFVYESLLPGTSPLLVMNNLEEARKKKEELKRQYPDHWKRIQLSWEAATTRLIANRLFNQFIKTKDMDILQQARELRKRAQELNAQAMGPNVPVPERAFLLAVNSTPGMLKSMKDAAELAIPMSLAVAGATAAAGAAPAAPETGLAAVGPVFA